MTQAAHPLGVVTVVVCLVIGVVIALAFVDFHNYRWRQGRWKDR